MPWYAESTDWTATDTPPDDGLAVQVQTPPDDRPLLRVQTKADTYLLSGTDPRPDTDTTHTVARVDPDTGDGVVLFTVHASGQNLIFEEAPDADVEDSLYDHVRSALNEIMIPVYIDDVVEDVSEKQSGLIALHTAQYDTDGGWTYFRTSLFQNGDLQLEDEYGEM